MNWVISTALGIFFSIILAVENGVFGFMTGACLGIIFFFLTTYKYIIYDSEKIVIKTLFRRRIINLRHVARMSFTHEFTLMDGRKISINHKEMYDQEKMLDMLAFVRIALGKNDAYLDLRQKYFDTLECSSSDKGYREAKAKLESRIKNYDSSPVKYSEPVLTNKLLKRS